VDNLFHFPLLKLKKTGDLSDHYVLCVISASSNRLINTHGTLYEVHAI